MRGSGRFLYPTRPQKTTWYVSIPFIAGQWSLRYHNLPAGRCGLYVSIPFIAGQWSILRTATSYCVGDRVVSIPFIAGQWSLLFLERSNFHGKSRRFNPLHCGAVVASPHNHGCRGLCRSVSIPFIAGQWSLRVLGLLLSVLVLTFQSPSLRGSGRFRPPPLFPG